MADRDTLRTWLDRYEAAWRSNDPDTVRGLFTEDATYRWHPWEKEQAVTGADAIARAWLDEPDAPDSWTLRCEPVAVDGDMGVARCITTYAATADEPGRVYHNIFLVRLTDDGRASDFTEYFMKEPGPEGT
jgi:ketosteroid isomerase-like protein